MLIPGLGVDADIYQPQRRDLADWLAVPRWMPPLAPRERFESYARRLADEIRGMPGLSRPFTVGGISFGGMLAAEIADCCSDDVAGLFLIAACTRRQRISPAFHAIARSGQLLPRGLVSALSNRIMPAAVAWWEALGPEEAELVHRIYFRADVPLLKWSALAMSRWRSGAEPRCPTFRAHGRLDSIIPIRERALRPGVDLVVPDGRHLINLTHARAVNRWLLSRLAELDARQVRHPPATLQPRGQ